MTLQMEWWTDTACKSCSLKACQTQYIHMQCNVSCENENQASAWDVEQQPVLTHRIMRRLRFSNSSSSNTSC